MGADANSPTFRFTPPTQITLFTTATTTTAMAVTTTTTAITDASPTATHTTSLPTTNHQIPTSSPNYAVSATSNLRVPVNASCAPAPAPVPAPAPAPAPGVEPAKTALEFPELGISSDRRTSSVIKGSDWNDSLEQGCRGIRVREVEKNERESSSIGVGEEDKNGNDHGFIVDVNQLSTSATSYPLFSSSPSFLSDDDHAGVRDLSGGLEQACKDVWRSSRQLMVAVGFISSVYWALMVFDMAGNVAVADPIRAAWAPITAVLMPVVVLISVRYLIPFSVSLAVTMRPSPVSGSGVNGDVRSGIDPDFILDSQFSSLSEHRPSSLFSPVQSRSSLLFRTSAVSPTPRTATMAVSLVGVDSMGVARVEEMHTKAISQLQKICEDDVL